MPVFVSLLVLNRLPVTDQLHPNKICSKYPFPPWSR